VLILITIAVNHVLSIKVIEPVISNGTRYQYTRGPVIKSTVPPMTEITIDDISFIRHYSSPCTKDGISTVGFHHIVIAVQAAVHHHPPFLAEPVPFIDFGIGPLRTGGQKKNKTDE